MRLLPILLSLMLAACGQTGALYLPDDKLVTTSEPPAPEQAPQQKKKDEETPATPKPAVQP